MKSIWTSLKRYKSLFLFIFILFLFGVVTGFLFYFKQDSAIRSSIPSSLDGLFQTNVFAFSTIFYHFVLLLFIAASLFCFIGLPLLILYIFFEGIGIGFLIPVFFSLYKVNAIWYFSVYFLCIKFIYFFLLLFLFCKFFNFLKYYVICIRKKSYDFLANLKYIILFLIIILLNDCMVYFVGNRMVLSLLG